MLTNEVSLAPWCHRSNGPTNSSTPLDSSRPRLATESQFMMHINYVYVRGKCLSVVRLCGNITLTPTSPHIKLKSNAEESSRLSL